MSTIHRFTFPVNKDVWLANDGANKGNGKGPSLIVGAIGSQKDRAEMTIPYNLLDKGFSVADAGLTFKVIDSTCISRGSSPAFHARECTGVTTLHEGSEDGECHASDNGGGSALVWPGDTSTAVNQGTYNPGTDPGEGWQTINLKDLIVAKFANESTRVGTLVLLLLALDETNIDQRIVFRSAQAQPANRPYLWVDIDTNRPPNAPGITSPVSGDPAIVASPDADSLTVEFLFNDPDAADTLQRAQLDVYSDAARTGALGAVLLSTGAVVPRSLGAPNKYALTGTGIADAGLERTPLRFAVKTQDNNGKWGAQSPVEDGRFQTAFQIGAPLRSDMGTDPNGPDNSSGPTIGGTLNSPDPDDYITAWEGNFYRDTPNGRVTLWASGETAIGGTSTRTAIVYGGTALQPGWVVKWQQRHTNRDGVVSPFTPIQATTMATAVGPSITPADDTTKLLSRTAQIVITFDNPTCDGYRWKLFRDGALIYDSGLVTISSADHVNVNLPAGYVNWCDDITISAADKPVGSGLGPYCPQSKLHVDCLPATRLEVVPG